MLNRTVTVSGQDIEGVLAGESDIEYPLCISRAKRLPVTKFAIFVRHFELLRLAAQPAAKAAKEPHRPEANTPVGREP